MQSKWTVKFLIGKNIFSGAALPDYVEISIIWAYNHAMKEKIRKIYKGKFLSCIIAASDFLFAYKFRFIWI